MNYDSGSGVHDNQLVDGDDGDDAYTMKIRWTWWRYDEDTI